MNSGAEMAIQRVALIFDNLARPETTGVYCRRALGQLAEVEHFLPTEQARIPRDGFDLCLAVDDGLSYPLATDLRPLAYWAIDTHIDFERALRRAEQCDFVFAAQQDGAERLRAAGIANPVWLPLACDPEFHHPHEVEKRFDVSFVGNVFPGRRAELLELIQKQFPNTFVGQRYFEDMAGTYSESRIVFNRSVQNDVNMRVFEALACGAFLLTNDLSDNGQNELFRDGVHLATYRSAEELLERIAYYLRHPDIRERIASVGRDEVLTKHTYRHRMQRILKIVDGGMASVAKPLPPADIHPAKDPTYFEFARPEVAELVPTTARRVLDIGCGAGRLGASIKVRQPAEVVGLELDPRAVRIAADHLDEVVTGNIEDGQLDFPEGRFDCIICADVLEHLRQPERVLAKIRRWLVPGGCLIASIPNVRNHTVITSLLEGNWTYESAGLLDADHVRFFTRREIEKLFFRAGFCVEELRGVPGPGYRDWQERGKPGEVRAGGLQIGGLAVESAEEFYIYQYLVKAHPTVLRDFGLTSIIILTHNELAYTRECLDSIRLRTDEPCELIVVDNGSTDGTVEYLRSLDGVKLIENRENRGFPAAVNQGIGAASGENILLLNNDCVVTTGWLRRLLNALDSDPNIGLVGPYSNNASGYQQVPVSYQDLAGLDGFAWDWGKQHNRQTAEVDRLIGFCLLIRRTVIDRIGLLDERFGIGCYEDDDFCRRARDAGYRCVIAGDAFVHHYGSRTFLGSGIDFATVLQENEAKFNDKWSNPMETPPPAVAPQPNHANGAPRRFHVAEAPGGGLRLQKNAVRLSLCMIVRDNENTIVPCLESIRPWVDEMVVVDTGSKDRTPEIVRQLGARLFHFPWCDDFSAARNESLKHAHGEWLFWMDSDDTISEECGWKLRALADGAHDPALLGYVMQVHCPGSGDDGRHDVTAVDHVKLIRNRPDLRFEGRIHEQVLPAIRRAGGEVAFTDISVVHSGSDHSPAGRQRKLERDLRILHRELDENPNHPFVLFNLGMTYADDQRHAEAVLYFRRSIEVSTADESHLRKAYALLASAQSQLDQHDAAWETCRKALELFPDDKELLFRSAILHHHLGRLREAEHTYLKVLQGREERHFTSVDQGLAGFKARQNLALVYQAMGRLEHAEEQWRLIVKEVPTYEQGWRGLGEVLLRQGKLDALQATIAQLTGNVDLHCLSRLLSAELLAGRGDVVTARSELEKARTEHPDDPAPLEALCRLLFERGDPSEAEALLTELTERNPTDAAAFHNLGTIYLRQGRFDAAVQAYRRSLEHRPHCAVTHLQLGYAYEREGQNQRAIAAWQTAVGLDPKNTAAQQALRELQPVT